MRFRGSGDEGVHLICEKRRTRNIVMVELTGEDEPRRSSRFFVDWNDLEVFFVNWNGMEVQ